MTAAGRVSPLIVTLSLDAAAQRDFDTLRRRHFPPAHLHVGAHVTLFHALPGDEECRARHLLDSLCAATMPFPVVTTGLRYLGRGVAYALNAPAAVQIRALLRGQLTDRLTKQDQAPWAPHVTVQNKVRPELARRTLAHLALLPLPGPAVAEGLALWRYCGGPWKAVARYRFGDTATPASGCSTVRPEL